MSDVVTGEAVALDLRIAQLPSRLTAAVLDLAVMAAVYGLVLLAMLWAGLGDLDDSLIGGIGVSLVVLVFLAYPVATETLTRGRSPGKMALGLRVVRDDGGPIAFRHALVRGLVGLALERPGIFLIGLGPAVGMLVTMFSSRGKRIADMAAGTVVLQERVPGRPLWTPTMPPPLAGWAPTLDLTGLDDALALSVREFLDRAGELVPHARETLAAGLVEEVRARTTPDPPPGTPGWAYLTAVLAERRRREEDRARRIAAPGPYGGPGQGQDGQGRYGGPSQGRYGQGQHGQGQHGQPGSDGQDGRPGRYQPYPGGPGQPPPYAGGPGSPPPYAGGPGSVARR